MLVVGVYRNCLSGSLLMNSLGTILIFDLSNFNLSMYTYTYD